jgi:Flp pilus assembly protein protease CpaA
MAILNLVELGSLPFVLAWLGWCIRHDLRYREVPNLITVIPMAMACLVGVLFDRWAAAFLVVVLILLADIDSYRAVLSIITTAIIALISPAQSLICVSIFLVWLFWEKGALGGADAKILIALLLLWGNPSLLIWIALAGGLQGLVAWLRKRPEIPYTVAILVGSLGFWFGKLFY